MRLLLAILTLLNVSNVFADQSNNYYQAIYENKVFVGGSCSAALQSAIGAAQNSGWTVNRVETPFNGICSAAFLELESGGELLLTVQGPFVHDCGDGMHSIVNSDGLSCSATDPNPGPVPGSPGAVCDEDTNKIFNSSGQCVDLKEADKISQCSYFGKSDTELNVQMQYSRDIGASVLPTHASSRIGCEVEVLEAIKCVTPPPSCGSNNGTNNCLIKESVCTAKARFTGEATPEDNNPSSSVCLNGPCETPSTDKITENQPCTYAGGVSGERLCTSTNSSQTPSIEENGQIIQQGNSVVNQVDTVEKTVINPDGSSTTTKTDSLTKYECTGNSCTQSTTTSTSTTSKGPTGSTTGSNTTCSGSHCNSNGSVNTGTGSTGGAGGSGNDPSGNCGSDGSPCTIDDSGFRNLSADADGFGDKLGADESKWLEKINSTSGTDMHGVDFEFTPQLPHGSCAPLTYGLPGKTLNIEWCEKAEIIKSVLAWLMYLFTAWFVFDSFFGRTDRASK
ncbi:hypothetical protein ACN99C_12195 [Pseudomonas alloputida]|uniref:hypothetical protein n=1 Tax=Pseudomonas alloputida TaxID=1940621 RepID=UPI003B42D00E